MLRKDDLFKGVSKDWLKLLDNKKLDKIIEKLNETDNEADDEADDKTVAKQITPPPNKIFEFARLTDLNNVKVIILGQDPYPKLGDAHGLSFSCLNGIPKSLNVIYKCLLNYKLIEHIPDHGNLTSWAYQGVLLLNRYLTTKVGVTLAHKCWNRYIKDIILHFLRTDTIFILWGAKAIELIEEIIEEEREENNANKIESIKSNPNILTYSHPSPISRKPFIGCKNFIDANELLKKYGKTPINWNSLNTVELSDDEGPEVNNDVDAENEVNYMNNLVVDEKEIEENNKKLINPFICNYQSDQTEGSELSEMDEYDNIDFIDDNDLVKNIVKSMKSQYEEQIDIYESLMFDDMTQTVFTDGSVYPNKTCKEAAGGYAAVFGLGPFDNLAIYGKLDNSVHFSNATRAEGLAIYESMAYASKYMSEWSRMIIITDNDFWIKMYMKYMPSWDKSGTDYTTKKNSDITIKSKQLYDWLHANGKHIEFRFIYSHNKSGWKYAKKNSYKKYCYDMNDIADKFAKYSRYEIKNGDTIIDSWVNNLELVTSKLNEIDKTKRQNAPTKAKKTKEKDNKKTDKKPTKDANKKTTTKKE